MPLFILPTITATIGTLIELGSSYYWLRISFVMPDITNPKTNTTVTGGELITVDEPVNFAGTTLLTQQDVANEFAEAYARAIINKQIMAIINT